MGNHAEHPVEVSSYIAVIKRRRFLILCFCLSATLTSLALTYIFSEKYTAYTSLLYRPQQAIQFQSKQQEALGFPVPFVLYESIGNTLEELARSDAILQQVVRALNLDKKVKKPEPNWLKAAFRDLKEEIKEIAGKAWQILKYGRIIEEDPFVQAVHGLRKNIAVKPSKKAYTFRLEAIDSDPARVASIIDTEARILIDFLQRENIRVAQKGRLQIEEQLGRKEKELSEMRHALEIFKGQEKIVSLKEETSLRLNTIAQLEEEIIKVERELGAMERKHQELVAQLGKREQFVRYMSTTTDNPIVQEMKLELARLGIQRSGLLEKYTPEHLEVKSIEAKLQQVREKLKVEVDKIVSSESLRLDDVYQKVLSDALTTDVEVKGLRVRLKTVADAVQQKRGELSKLTDKERRLAELSLQLEVGERSYKLLSEAYEEARITESKQISEVAVLHPAMIPSSPIRPIKIIHVGASAILSLILAIGFVFFLNLFDSSLRDVDQVEQVLKVPVLARIPGITNDKKTLTPMDALGTSFSKGK